MKKSIPLLSVSFLLLSILTGCEGDIGENYNPDTTTSLDGNYKSTGYYYAPVGGSHAININKGVTLESANVVSFVIGDIDTVNRRTRVTIDPVTNKLTLTAAPGGAGAPYTQFDANLPATGPGYTAAWPGSTLCNNTYDPVTRTFYIRVGMVGAMGWLVIEEHVTKL